MKPKIRKPKAEEKDNVEPLGAARRQRKRRRRRLWLDMARSLVIGQKQP